ncbi:MAG: GNAT family N-acetyltransferase [Ruegeria sp.]
MSVRPASVQDAKAIAEITNKVIRDTLITFTTDERTPDSIAADIESRGERFLVAELGREVVGFATYGEFRRGPGYAYCREHSIQLSPSARGHGLGRNLMERLEKIAVADGVHVLVAGISSENPGAIAFHASLGFSQIGRMPEVAKKWDRWLDLVLMQKILAYE